MEISKKFDLSQLTRKEEKYFRMIYPQSGVLFLYSEPGIAKTQIMKSIARKLNLHYIDLRLCMRDETDVGLYPDKTQITTSDGKTMNVLDHVVPRWAVMANQPPGKCKGTLIHFEELNRAPLPVRNAALQILLERGIGDDFTFNDNVYMVSSGNMGEADGSDVEEFDSALNGRLISYKHTLSLDEWVENFAEKNVNKHIVNFLLAHPENYYTKKKQDNPRSYASPRSWTFLSDYIRKNYGDDAKPSTWLKDVQNIGSSYVGSTSATFVRFLQESVKVSITDVIDSYGSSNLKGKLNRDRKSQLLNDLIDIKIAKLSDDKLENIKLFLLDLEDDEVVSYLIKLMDTQIDISNMDTDLTKSKSDNQAVINFIRDKRFSKFRDKLKECAGKYTQKKQ